MHGVLSRWVWMSTNTVLTHWSTSWRAFSTLNIFHLYSSLAGYQKLLIGQVQHLLKWMISSLYSHSPLCLYSTGGKYSQSWYHDDNTMSFDAHVNAVCKAVNYHAKALRHIRKRVTTGVALTIASTMVGARPDYCNAILHEARLPV